MSNVNKLTVSLSDIETQPRTLVEGAYRQLRRDIIEGHLVAGEKLRVEHLKEQYKTGSGTLREALTMLLSDALVVSEGQRGFHVATISLEDFSDITNTRVMLETQALRIALKKGDDEWEASLIAAFHRLGKAEEKRDKQAHAFIREWEQRNSDFHEALLSACDSRWLHHLIGLLYRQSERYRHLTLSHPVLPRDVHAEHTLIFDAALKRDSKKACTALEQHIRLTFDSIKVLLAK
jgi:GntR family carbon starvation induced transcriptional regulator